MHRFTLIPLALIAALLAAPAQINLNTPAPRAWAVYVHC